MLHRVIYVSAARRPLAPDELAALLDGSRRRNAAIDVTGLMLYHDGSILQILEGPEDKVQALFRTICDDPRHRQVITMASGPVEARAFPDWRMGFADVTALPPPLRDTVLSLRELAGEMPTDRKVAMLVKTFLRGFRDLSGLGVAP